MALNLNPRDFVFLDERNKTLVKLPGSIQGRDFVIDGCQDCEIAVFCRSSQILVDYCVNCKIFVGPVGGPVFIRNATNCTVVISAAQQLRTRDCENSVLIVALPGYPIIESSSGLRFGGFNIPEVYASFADQLCATSLAIKSDAFKEVFDFSKDAPPAGEHWRLLSDEETSESLRLFNFQRLLPEHEQIRPEISDIEETVSVVEVGKPPLGAADQLLRSHEPDEKIGKAEIPDPEFFQIYLLVWKIMHGNFQDAEFDDIKINALAEIVRSQIPGISEASEFVSFLGSDFLERHRNCDLLERLAAGEASAARFSGFLEKPETPYFAIYLLLRKSLETVRKYPTTADLAAFAICVSDRETVIGNFFRLQNDETEGERIVQQAAAWTQGDKATVVEIASWMATARPDCLQIIQGALEIDGISDFPAYELHGMSALLRQRPIVGIRPVFALVSRIVECAAEMVEKEDKDPESLPNVVIIDLNELIPVFVNAQYQVEIENIDFQLTSSPVEHDRFSSVRLQPQIGPVVWNLEIIDGTNLSDAKLILSSVAESGNSSQQRLIRYGLDHGPFRLRAPADWRLTAVKEMKTSLEFAFTARDPLMSGNFKAGLFSISDNEFNIYLHKDPRTPEIQDVDLSSYAARVKRQDGGLLGRELLVIKPNKRGAEEISVVNWNALADSLTPQAKSKPKFPHGNWIAGDGSLSAESETLPWEERKFQILSEILSLNADVVALQEIDHFADFLEPAMKKEGYAGIWQAKTGSPGIFQGGFSDGVCLFWRTDQFKLLTSDSAYVSVERFPYVWVLLEHLRSRKKILAFSVHLKAGASPEAKTRRAQQILRLQTIIEHKRNEVESSGFFLAGDFNCESDELESLAFKDAFAKADGMTTQKLRDGAVLRRKSDFILFDGEIELCSALQFPDKSYLVPDSEYPSDHFSMLAKFTLRGDLPETRISRISDSVQPPPPPPARPAPALSQAASSVRIMESGAARAGDTGDHVTVVLSGFVLGQAEDVADGIRLSLVGDVVVRIILSDGTGQGSPEYEALTVADIFVWVAGRHNHERWAQLGWMIGRRAQSVLLFEPTGTSSSLLQLANENSLTGRLLRESTVRMAAGDFLSLGTTLATRIMAARLDKQELETPWSEYFNRVIGEFGFSSFCVSNPI